MSDNDEDVCIYYCLLKILLMIIVGATKYIPTFSRIKLIPNPRTVSSESNSTWFRMDRDVSSGVIASFTASLNKGFSLSKSARIFSF